jgi:protocatechuate 3,4-dioxygenase beta subunit
LPVPIGVFRDVKRASFESDIRELASGSTDGGGRVVIPLATRHPFRVRVVATGFGEEESGPHARGQSLRIRLRAAASLSGRVTLDGAALTGARVRVRRAQDEQRGAAAMLGETASDANGVYRLGGLAAGAVEVLLLPPSGSVPRGTPLELVAGAETVHDFAVLRGVRVTGRVLDAASGQGIAGALVGLGWRAQRPVACDAEGRFEYVDFSAEYGELSASAPDYGDLAVTVPRGDVAPQLEFRLRRARQASGRIVTTDGRGIAGAFVAAAGYEVVNDQPQRIDWRSTHSDADGRYRLEGLRADLGHVLLAHAEGFGLRQLEFPADEAEHETIPLPDLVLEPGLVLRGSVVDERGEPRAARVVTLRGSADGRHPRGVPAPDGYRFVDSYVAERSALTDALGRFAFADLAPGSYRVAASLPLGRSDTPQELRVERGVPLAPVRLVQFVGLAIRGRIRVGDGAALPRCYVSIDPLDGAATATDVECDRSGEFVATGLARGVYRVTVYPYPSESDRAAGRIFEAAILQLAQHGLQDAAVAVVVDLDRRVDAARGVEGRDLLGPRVRRRHRERWRGFRLSSARCRTTSSPVRPRVFARLAVA